LKVLWKILKKGLFSGAWISENGRQAEFAQQPVRGLVDSHRNFILLVFGHLSSPSAMFVGFRAVKM
jgi:hypothetical protein